MFHGCPPSPDAWGRLNVVTPFHHLSGDSHINRSLRAGPITASSGSLILTFAKVAAAMAMRMLESDHWRQLVQRLDLIGWRSIPAIPESRSVLLGHLAFGPGRERGSRGHRRQDVVPGMWLRKLGRRAHLCDIEVVNDHMIAGAKLSTVGKQVIELVTVKNVNNSIRIGGAGGT